MKTGKNTNNGWHNTTQITQRETHWQLVVNTIVMDA
jgi:hypothetical protein